ncbi:MAG: hypothetical protein QOG38_544 [Hyphomicrobiales bacterium]|nr:hypothetical protein [Hyphomicrobiales bacterium]
MHEFTPGFTALNPGYACFEMIWLETNAWWLDDPKLNPTR